VAFWQPLFQKKKTLSPRKRRKKADSMGWRGWGLVLAAIGAGAALALLVSELSRSGRQPAPPAETQPADSPTPGDPGRPSQE
jgi:hypothetical protein